MKLSYDHVNLNGLNVLCFAYHPFQNPDDQPRDHGRKFGSYGQMEKHSQEARKKLERGERQKKEDAGARKGRKVAKHCVFPMFCGSGGSKSGLAKAAGAEPAGQMRGEKLHAIVARSTFASQKWQNTSVSDNL